DALGELQRRLAERDLEGRRLHTSHAFHSAMMEPILECFTEEVAKTTLNAPAIPWVSNLTGTWVTAAEVTEPSYWARQLRQTVRFGDGITTLAGKGGRIFLEIGPGQTLSSLVRQAPERPVAIPSMRHPRDTDSADQAVLLTALGRLWLAGRHLDGSCLYAGEKRRHLPLPGYSFERHRYLIERGAGIPAAPEAAPEERTQIAGQLHARPGLDTEYVASRNELEERIASIWQELLGVEEIGVHDRFLDLGGHSLLATQVVSRLYDLFEIRFPLEQLFDRSTVADLARQLDKLLWTTRGTRSATRVGDEWEEGE
ncbi:MAG: acyltransferase domain-containing protein, partial [bacterium]|nr:acyltransferase domain-containing protein [bacterium]